MITIFKALFPDGLLSYGFQSRESHPEQVYHYLKGRYLVSHVSSTRTKIVFTHESKPTNSYAEKFSDDDLTDMHVNPEIASIEKAVSFEPSKL